MLIIELSPEQGFSYALPEELKTGKWNVYRSEQLVQTLHVFDTLLISSSFKSRSARSPVKLISRFADHPEIGTLHDNFV